MSLLPVQVATAQNNTPGCQVAIYGSPSVASWLTDVQSKISNTGLFDSVQAFHVGVGNSVPTTTTLQNYDSVLVFSDSPFSDKVAMGDALAGYLDAGGGVVLATFGLYQANHPNGIAGRLVTGNYLPFVPGNQAQFPALQLVADQPAHPLLSGVITFTGGTSSYRNIVALASGATQIAHWSNNTPLVATKPLTTGTIVGLNFFPPSNSVNTGFWNANSQGARLMANALLWSGCPPPPNALPVAQNVSISLAEDVASPITLLASDLNNDPLTYTLLSTPIHGSLSGVGANLTYTPTANYHGSDSFTFKANDGQADSNIATVTLTIASVNDAPSFSAGNNITVNEDDGSHTILWASNISAGPTDEANQFLTFDVFNSRNSLFSVQPAINPSTGDLTFALAPDKNGLAIVTVKLVDDGNLGNGGVNHSSEVRFNITVGAVNDTPSAPAQSVTTDEDVSTAIILTSSDVDDDNLTYTIIDAPVMGTLSGVVPNLTYTPNANYHGNDRITYKVNDGQIDSSLATIHITVNPINDAPTANGQTVTGEEDSASSITLSGTDIDGDTLSFTTVSQPAHGILSGVGANLTYTPNSNFHGSDSFIYKVNDGLVDSAEATVTILVHANNDAPVANAQSLTTNEDSAANVTLIGSDLDGDVLSFVVVTQPAYGSLGGIAPNLVYTPTDNFNGNDSFTFKVSDSLLDSAETSVNIVVYPVNDAPTAEAQTVATDENVAKNITMLGNDADGDTLTYQIVSPPTHGILSGNAPDVTYTPATHFHGSDSFAFVVNDGTVDSTQATVNLTVDNVNDAPVADAQAVTTLVDNAVAITLTGSDVDGDVLGYLVDTQPAHGTLSGTAPNLLYMPNANFSGEDSFTFKVNDGAAESAAVTVAITVIYVNRPPETQLDSQPANPSTNNVSFSFSGTDVDGMVDHFECSLDNNSFVACSNPQNYIGLMAGSHTFQVRAVDDQGSSDLTPASYLWNVQASQAQVTIVLDSNPGRTQETRFDYSGPDANGAILLDDPDYDDRDAYKNSKTITVTAGTFVVSETVANGWHLTAINCTSSVGVTPDLRNKRVSLNLNGGDDITCTFVTGRGVSVYAWAYNSRWRGLVFNSTGASISPYLLGWEFKLFSTPSTVITTGLTTNNLLQGVTFVDLPPGAYVLCETLQAGWLQTDPYPTSVIPGYEGKPCKALNMLPGKTALIFFGQRQATVSGADLSLEEAEGSIEGEFDQIIESSVEEEVADEDAASSRNVYLPVIAR